MLVFSNNTKQLASSGTLTTGNICNSSSTRGCSAQAVALKVSLDLPLL